MEWPILSRPRIVHLVEQRLSERLLGAAMLSGQPGAGKTTVARQVADRWADQGGEVLELVGLPELSDVPLAAFGPHAGELGLRAADLSATAVVAAVGALPTAPLLVVDDAPQLDATSAAVVYQLIRAYGLRAVLTARPDDISSGPIERLLHEQVAVEVAVGGFDAYEIRLLLRRRYDAPPRPDDVARLLRQTAGNPLLLREIVTRTEEWGRARTVAAGVELDPVDVPTDVRRSIADRIDDLGPSDLELVATVALGAGAPEDVLLTPAQRRQVRALIDAGILARTKDATLRTMHPVLGEAALARLDGVRHAAVLTLVADRLAAAGEPGLRFSAVLLRSESALPPSRADLEWAIGHAYGRGEHLLVVQLHDAATAAAVGGPVSVGADLHRAASLSWLGQLDEADLAFASVVERTVDPADRALLVSRFGAHLAYRRHDVSAALRLAGEQRGHLGEADRAALEPELRTWKRLRGDATTEATADDGDAVSGSSPGGETAPQMAVRSAIAAILVNGMGGRAGDEVASRLVELERLHGVLEPHAADMVHAQRYFRLLVDGQGDAAQELLEERRARCAADAAGLWTYLLAAHLTLRGQLSRAATLAGFAVELLTWRDPVGFIGPALTLRAAIAAQVGDLAQAELLLAEVPDQHLNDPRTAVLRSSARAVILAGHGATEAARRLVIETADDAAAAGHQLLAAIHTSIAIRMGASEDAAAILDKLRADAGDLGLYVILDEAAGALTRRDAAAALAAAQGLVAAGLEVTAIDLLHQAEQLTSPVREAQLRQRIVRARQRLASASEATVLAPTGPSAGSHGDDPTGLTDRESEIASLIAARLTNREIATRLGISASTVDNHLTNIYRKLGVHGRVALRALLSTSDGNAP